MKKTLLLAFALCGSLNVFSQATSLTIDCQTPGWLSSKIGYSDQQTLRNLKVTGYINATDLEFIKELNINHALRGVIDLEDVQIAKGGTINKDNSLFSSVPIFRSTKKIQKLIYPKALIEGPLLPFGKNSSEKVDSVIWTSTNITHLNIQNGVCGNCGYVSLPEGIKQINLIPKDIRIVFPSSISKVDSYGGDTKNLTIYSYIENPETVYAKHEDYYSDGSGGKHYSYWSTITNSTFYIPKGSMEKYLRSDFAIMDFYEVVNGNYMRISNGNVFIEYYDIERTEVVPSMTLYKGETSSLNVQIYPDAYLVSYIDFSSSNPDIVGIDSEGSIVAHGYGQAEVSATPHVFIDGFETKTGTCVVKVIAHTEGVEMAESLSIHIGEQKELQAYTLPLEVSDNQIVFSSNDPSVAKVSENGVIVGVKRGTCTITATSVDGGYTAECVVTVLQPVEAVTMEKHSISMKVGETENLFAQIAPTAADNKTILWSSLNEQLATVSANGEVTALKAGTVWIKAISEDNAEAKDSCKVTILQPVTGLSLNHNTFQLEGIGSSFELEATVLPDDASNKNIKWKSSDESVCVVSNGVVVAVGTGTCVIIATTEDGGYLATCTVTVNIDTSISSVDLSGSELFQVYDANGIRKNKISQGINLIRFADGTMKKVLAR